MPRLDEWLVIEGIFPSRSKAIRFIREIGITVNGKLTSKPSQQIKITDRVEFDINLAFKYSKPLGYFKLEYIESQILSSIFTPKDQCLDLGASVGGFSLYMLEKGVKSVCAIEISETCKPFLEIIQKEWKNFVYFITNIFEADPRNLTASFNIITADLTIEPYFLINNFEIFQKFLNKKERYNKLLFTIKIGTKRDIITLHQIFERKIREIYPKISLKWLKSLPTKLEEILFLELEN